MYKAFREACEERTELLYHPAFAEIAEVDLSDVTDRVLSETGMSADRVADAVDEYRKFLFLAALGTSRMSMCSKDVDEVWHAHILFTNEYAGFCFSVYGGYLHHAPKTARAPLDPDGAVNFKDAYEAVFGDLHPIWNGYSMATCILKPPICDDGAGRCTGECGDCGECKEDVGKCILETDKDKGKKSSLFYMLPDDIPVKCVCAPTTVDLGPAEFEVQLA